MSLGCSSVGRILASNTQSLGFSHQHHVHQLWQLVPVTLALWRWNQKDREFKGSLSYIKKLRSAWATGDTIFKNK